MRKPLGVRRDRRSRRVHLERQSHRWPPARRQRIGVRAALRSRTAAPVRQHSRKARLRRPRRRYRRVVHRTPPSLKVPLGTRRRKWLLEPPVRRHRQAAAHPGRERVRRRPAVAATRARPRLPARKGHPAIRSRKWRPAVRLPPHRATPTSKSGANPHWQRSRTMSALPPPALGSEAGYEQPLPTARPAERHRTAADGGPGGGQRSAGNGHNRANRPSAGAEARPGAGFAVCKDVTDRM